ncbi:uncharacterized protein ARMOST_06654 [Armillaria ostoyae]|uniref:Uncharacterized protein n=1 Tax=Armillaria ostoyae TaxID=47428 RepID=A0A284R3L3_ARMOS|nr:uncharacterized protein ARMOST_06654 [Armillaria ostoyae]
MSTPEYTLTISQYLHNGPPSSSTGFQKMVHGYPPSSAFSLLLSMPKRRSSCCSSLQSLFIFNTPRFLAKHSPKAPHPTKKTEIIDALAHSRIELRTRQNRACSPAHNFLYYNGTCASTLGLPFVVQWHIARFHLPLDFYSTHFVAFASA